MQTNKQLKPNLYNFNRQSCVDSKILEKIFFTTPFVSIDLVSPLINGLNFTKATGLSGTGPRLLKLPNTVLATSISALINKSNRTLTFSNQLKWLTSIQIMKNSPDSNPQNGSTVAKWYRLLDSRPRGRRFEPHRRHCVAH